MQNSNLAIYQEFESDVSIVKKPKIVQNIVHKEPRMKFDITHNFLNDFDVKLERDGFFDDLGSFLS